MRGVSTAVWLAVVSMSAGCAATTKIISEPAGAQVYIDGQQVGETPYDLTDTKNIFQKTDLKLVKPGFEPVETTFTRREQVDVGPLVGSICLVPGLWAMKYDPIHKFSMKKAKGAAATPLKADGALRAAK